MNWKRPNRIRPWVWVLLAGIGTSALAQHHNQHDPRALAEDPTRSSEPLAPVLEGMGDHRHAITTRFERAQMFFDQGLRLTYAFNHQEALRSFKEAVRLDPECAMCYWGWALVLGPNLNLPMDPSVTGQAFHAIQEAVARKGSVTPKESAFIDALAARYRAEPDAPRTFLDHAYAEAMAGVFADYPADPDAATLYAAALMNVSPWNYWTADGKPRDYTDDILAALGAALAVDAEHEGALHYTIHAVEAVDPERGEAVADTLRGLAPNAGHLVHMPSHIYMRLGRYADAYDVNADASEADESYLSQCRAQGIYPLGYYPHNVHFQAWAAFMQGRGEEALALARKVAKNVPSDRHGNQWGLYQTFLSMPLFAMVRFGQWQAVLAEPRPPAHLNYWTGIWHYAQGLAYTHSGSGRVRRARRHVRALRDLVADPHSARELIGFSNGASLMSIATEILAGEMAAARQRYPQALGHLERAVRMEDGMFYNEPPDWYYPTRHTLGAVLLEAGYPGEAEAVYWRDLEENPENGFALYGLRLSLEAQDRGHEAAEIDARFAQAWAAADTDLTSSRY
jgi:tetratricopeptide (TPR) repeat protein